MKKIPAKLKKYEEYLRSTEKPANEITFKRGSTLPWESKCGGCPYLEKEEDYPRDESGDPMMFLAQINPDEMPPPENFPEHGLLRCAMISKPRRDTLRADGRRRELFG